MPVGHYDYDATLTFPDKAWQAVAYIAFVVCLAINSGILARRAAQCKRTFTTFQPLSSTWLCDTLALLVFIISFLFIVINGVLTFGVGTHLSETCDASVVLCVSVFVLSKVVLYLYYLERLYIFSWARKESNQGIKPVLLGRFRCTPWLGGAFIFVFGVPCAILLGFSKEFALLHKPGQEQAVGCHVFLKWALATPIIVWAAIINTYILIAFFWPLARKHLSHSPELKAVARGSSWSILVSGICTVINLSILLILKGEHGIECLLCCSIDVLVNTLVLAIITDSRGEEKSFPMIHEEYEDVDGNQVQGKDLMPSVNSALNPVFSTPEEHDKVSRTPQQA